MQVKVILPRKASTGVENTLAGRTVDLLFLFATGLTCILLLELNLGVILARELTLLFATLLLLAAIHLGLWRRVQASW